MPKKISQVDINRCVACGTCENECPTAAIKIWKGCYAKVELAKCVGCTKCYQVCPSGAISMIDR